MKKIYLFISICVFGFTAKAQQNSVSAGGDATGSGGSVSYSIGQVNYVSASDANNSVSQGVQQPYEISVVTAVKENSISLELNVYPNPTIAGVKLNAPANTKNLSCMLLDVEGKLISQQKVTDTNTNIAMDKLAIGTYMLSVYQNDKIVKTFRIVKNQ